MNPIKQQPLNWRHNSLRRYFVDRFFQAQMVRFGTLKNVLDLGGQKVAKRGQFNIHNYDVEVLYVNISPTKGVDLLSDAAHVGLKGNSFDLVICGEVLEHVPNPVPVLAEAHRLLKPGGYFLATVPFLFRIHADPHDYGRYTDYFWQENLASLKFKNITIEHQGLFYSVMANHFEAYLKSIRPPRPFGRPVHWLLTRGIANPLKSLAVWHESKNRVKKNAFLKSYTTGFGIKAQK